MTLLNMFLTNKSLVYLMHNVYTKAKKYLSSFLPHQNMNFKKLYKNYIRNKTIVRYSDISIALSE